MHLYLIIAILSLYFDHSFAFTQSAGGRKSEVIVLNVYVPDGLSRDQWEKIKKEEAAKKNGNLGRSGPRGFQSRSMQSFQKDLEAGKVGHLLPIFNAKEKLARGEIKPEDIPYMQRGGNWDNSDVKGAKKLAWNDLDKREQGKSKNPNPGLDWTGTQARKGPVGTTANVSAKAPSNSSSSPTKRFGLF